MIRWTVLTSDIGATSAAGSNAADARESPLATVWQIVIHDGQGACAYATPNRTARSLHNVSASLLNRSISDPTAAASAESDASRPRVRNSCLRCCSVSEETFPFVFPLEFDDELPGCAHQVTIEQSAAVEEGGLCKPQLHRFLQFLGGRNAISARHDRDGGGGGQEPNDLRRRLPHLKDVGTGLSLPPRIVSPFFR